MRATQSGEGLGVIDHGPLELGWVKAQRIQGADGNLRAHHPSGDGVTLETMGHRATKDDQRHVGVVRGEAAMVFAGVLVLCGGLDQK